MLQEQNLVAACRTVSAKYGEDVGQDVAIMLLTWERRGTLHVENLIALKKLALYCGQTAMRYQKRICHAGVTIPIDFSDDKEKTGIGTVDHLIGNESVADRMEICRLRQLLLDPKNQRVIQHVLKCKETPISRARLHQLLIPFVNAGYITKKRCKARKHSARGFNFKGGRNEKIT